MTGSFYFDVFTTHSVAHLFGVFLCRFANNDFLNDTFLLADNRLLFRLGNLDYNLILVIAGAGRPIYRTSINRTRSLCSCTDCSTGFSVTRP